MQLLRMTMQQEQEGEGSADHGSPQTSPHPDNASQSFTVQRHIPDLQEQSRGDTSSTSSFCRLLPRGSACRHEHGSNTLPLPGSSAGLMCSVTGHNLLSVALCNHQLCHTASLAGNSEVSSLPDVNCNTLTTRFSVADSLCSGDGEVLKPVVLEQVVSPDANQDIKTDMCAFERKLPLRFGNTANSDESDSSLLETREERPGENHSVTESSSWLTPQAAFCHDSVDGIKRAENVLQVENEEPLQLHLLQVNNTQVCELLSQPEQVKVDSSTSGILNSSSEACSKLSTNLPGQEEAHESDVNLRNSVDMDVEESDSDEGPSVQSANKSFTPYIPQTAADNDLAGRDQSLTSVDVLLDKLVNSSSVKTTPESIPEKRSVLSISPNASLQSTNLQVIPPIWTTLALRSAARYNLLEVSPNTEPPVSATANAHTQCISDSLLSEETRAIVEILNHNVSISSKMMRPDTCFKSTPFFGNHNHSLMSGFRSSTATSKRSPLRGILRPKHGRMTRSALKNPDVFLEALLEDECALYAGRLQSFFKNSKTDSDREEIPDPVARTLTEGDDMHFMPICDESTRGCRPAFEDSKFAACIPVWESVA